LKYVVLDVVLLVQRAHKKMSSNPNTAALPLNFLLTIFLTIKTRHPVRMKEIKTAKMYAVKTTRKNLDTMPLLFLPLYKGYRKNHTAEQLTLHMHATVALMVGRAGFEPATFRLSVERSSQAELPAHVLRCQQINIMLVNKNFHKSFNLLTAFLVEEGLVA
jgi:hypothetical protein